MSLIYKNNEDKLMFTIYKYIIITQDKFIFLSKWLFSQLMKTNLSIIVFVTSTTLVLILLFANRFFSKI